MRLLGNLDKQVMKMTKFGVAIFSTTLLFVSSPIQAQQAPSDSLQYARGLSTAFEQVADQITPAMVSISSVKKARVVSQKGRRQVPDPFFEPFRDFFGDDFMERFGQPDNQEGFAQQGLGTGVIIDDKGHILTNNHVIGEADEVTVKLHDKRTFKAKIVGADPRSDLAVIRITTDKLTPAKLGNSDKLKTGEWVVAAGNPFGLDNSITAGIVSAKGRSLVGGTQYEDFIQTDAAINPGNSGGPLVNLNGEVVGINTAIFSRSGGYMGIGFAIPINMARNVLESLISKGKVVRGWLGIGIQNLTEDLAKSFEYAGSEGALVGHVEPDGPAEDAGIKQGDIVVALDGDKIVDVNQLRNTVAAKSPGSKVTLDIVRDGRKKSIEVSVGELPTNIGEALVDEETASESDLGISVENLTPDLARRLHSKHTKGVVVTGVRPDGIAVQSGIQPKDIIVSVNSDEVNNVEQFMSSIKKGDLKKGIRLVIESQGMTRYVFLRSED